MIYQPRRSPLAKLARRMRQARACDRVSVASDQPMVSFTFDDAPLSAAKAGAYILERADARATYYVSQDLAGIDNHLGRHACEDDLIALAERGHELGCHTASHLDAAAADPDDVETDAARNRAWLTQLTGAPPRAFAFPYGEASPEAKVRLGAHYETLRGVRAGVNRAGCDRLLLKSTLLAGDGASGSAFDATPVAHDLKAVAHRGGWLIVFTHDVRQAPSAWGCTPQLLSRAVAAATDLGVQIAPVSEAFDALSQARRDAAA